MGTMDRLFDNFMRLYIILLTAQTNLEQMQVDNTIISRNQEQELNQTRSEEFSTHTTNGLDVYTDSNSVLSDNFLQSKPLASTRLVESSPKTELNFVLVSASTIAETCYLKVKRGRGRPRKNSLNK
ncbi:predicted protein [Naegleria gruberi]|uniref:Predicted protein n=1 Tax=Naegleria gruberi TaxID=5762 RepID=D2VW53_NAEGR|nr:uncharacterized protein NAEGRDRAFT_73253 [Naegleria gruberi]EFC38958.1 predicted protein [Naegleria gruberi]|eukprot:XP_002671702.1 predicted protein [Naegleria gruberi strain NEG-M]